MYNLNRPPLGIYEKALPKDASWLERLKMADQAGFDFVEISIDESDERLARLEWTSTQRMDFLQAIAETGVRVPSMCLSGHRKFPLGSQQKELRTRGLEIMKQAIEFSVDLGIRNVQLAGYDVYYEVGSAATRQTFVQGLKQAVRWASKAQVMLSIEIMDHPYMNSISKFLELTEEVSSPWLTVYPDIGNLSAWGNNIQRELTKGFDKISAIHLKDTMAVTGTFGGKFKQVPFGQGCVDFVELFRILNELDYSGSFLLEMWTENSADPFQEVVTAKEWMLNKMREGGYTLC